MHVLDPIEAGRLVAVERDDRLGSMAVLALATGMRMAEVLGLRWCDVDLDAGVRRDTYAFQRIDGRLTLVQPKTERSRRAIPLPSVALDVLRRQHSQWHDDQLAAGGHWKRAIGEEPAPTDPVFTNVKGTALSPERAWHAFKRLLRSAGLPETIRFHDLRHFAASLLLASGVPMREVADVLGDSSTTLMGSTTATSSRAEAIGPDHGPGRSARLTFGPRTPFAHRGPCRAPGPHRVRPRCPVGRDEWAVR